MNHNKTKTGAKRQKKVKAAKEPDTYHHGDLKAALLHAAVGLLKTRHPTELSLRELAREAGVTQAAPYRHFKSKEELLASLGEQGFELQAKYMQEAWDKNKANAYDLYISCGLSYFKMGQKHPQHFKLMFGTHVVKKEDYPDFLKAACKTFVMLRRMIEECQKQDLIGPGNPYHKALNCWSVVHGFTNLYTEGRFDWLGVTAENAEEALKVLLEQYLRGNKTELVSPNFSPLESPDSKFYKELMEKIID